MAGLSHTYGLGNPATASEGALPVRSLAHGDMVVGISGTFDVENYGDLLFPLIAAAALKRRNSRIRVEPFSVNGKSATGWPFQVRPVEELIGSLSTLSAMLIGGGQIVRFDKFYPVPTPANVDLPFAFWLTPAVLAALIGKPLIWNAVGASMSWPHSAWHDELMRQAFAASYFIGVRDQVSRDELLKVAPDAAIEVLPDTAFGLSRLWPLKEESVEFKNWRMSLGVGSKYGVIQANMEVGKYRSIIELQMESMGANPIILPVCWLHGDRAEQFPELKISISNREWLTPKLISEIIGRSEFVVASSLHACITALSYGVPVARPPISSGGKFELLDEFEGIAYIDNLEALSRLRNRGRQIEPRVIEYADRLDRYWDDVTRVVLHPPVAGSNLSRTLMLLWVAKMCGDRRHLGPAQRLAVTLRESLARYFPNQRAAVRHRLSSLKNSVVTASRSILLTPTPPVVEPEAESKMPPVQAFKIAVPK